MGSAGAALALAAAADAGGATSCAAAAGAADVTGGAAGGGVSPPQDVTAKTNAKDMNEGIRAMAVSPGGRFTTPADGRNREWWNSSLIARRPT